MDLKPITLIYINAALIVLIALVMIVTKSVGGKRAPNIAMLVTGVLLLLGVVVAIGLYFVQSGGQG